LDYALGGGSSGGIARDGGVSTMSRTTDAVVRCGSDTDIADEAITVGAHGAID
jgi:hypothetical protein